jgi:hypothetical protein
VTKESCDRRDSIVVGGNGIDKDACPGHPGCSNATVKERGVKGLGGGFRESGTGELYPKK